MIESRYLLIHDIAYRNCILRDVYEYYLRVKQSKASRREFIRSGQLALQEFYEYSYYDVAKLWSPKKLLDTPEFKGIKKSWYVGTDYFTDIEKQVLENAEQRNDSEYAINSIRDSATKLSHGSLSGTKGIYAIINTGTVVIGDVIDYDRLLLLEVAALCFFGTIKNTFSFSDSSSSLLVQKAIDKILNRWIT